MRPTALWGAERGGPGGKQVEEAKSADQERYSRGHCGAGGVGVPVHAQQGLDHALHPGLAPEQGAERGIPDEVLPSPTEQAADAGPTEKLDQKVCTGGGRRGGGVSAEFFGHINVTLQSIDKVGGGLMSLRRRWGEDSAPSVAIGLQGLTSRSRWSARCVACPALVDGAASSPRDAWAGSSSFWFSSRRGAGGGGIGIISTEPVEMCRLRWTWVRHQGVGGSWFQNALVRAHRPQGRRRSPGGQLRLRMDSRPPPDWSRTLLRRSPGWPPPIPMKLCG